MAAAVVTVIIEDFLQRLSQGMELGPRWGVEPVLRKIHDLLSSVDPKVENKCGHSLELQEWVLKLKDAIFEAEDLLEEFSTEATLRQPKREAHRRLFQNIGKLMFGRKMRRQLRVVAERLNVHIRSDLARFIVNVPGEIEEVDKARSIPLMGRDGEKRELMRALLDGDMEGDLPVLAVVGRPGSGKTSLVRELWSESRVDWYFNVKIWVNTYPPFDEYRMAREIIEDLTKEEENAVGEQLLNRISKLLDGKKRYLFVLDDLLVLNSESWRWLRFTRSLEGGASGSKILVTTRDYLPRQTSQESPPYLFSLGKLLVKDSLALLLQTAYKGGEEINNPEMLRIAEELAAECDGSPVIIWAVGGYLSFQHATDDWSRFRNMLHGPDKYSVFSSLLFGGYPRSHLSAMVKRYHGLPPGVKQCFGLCSLFPRDHEMDRQTLAALWTALGYIKPPNEGHRLLKDIANDYISRLVQEGLFRDKTTDTFGNIRSVRLHHGVEDLARSVAGWECRAHRDLNPLWTIPGYEKAWHLSITPGSELSKADSVLRRLGNSTLGRLRTFLYFVDDKGEYGGLCNYVIPLLKRTRVLDVHHLNTGTVPEGVWKLKHLKYLNLSDNSKMEMLPPAITGLLNLQTLKLSRCSALKELPRDMQKMISLRHLYIDGCWKLSLMPKGLGNLKSLNILTDFILPLDDSRASDSADLTDLCKLNDLRGSLKITNVGYSEIERVHGAEEFKIEEMMNMKSSLESVELRFRNLWTTDGLFLEKLRLHSDLKGLKIHNYGGIIFPGWIVTDLRNLVEIALIGCENCARLPPLGQLHKLKSISIQGMPDLESILDVADNMQSFSELSSLCIRDCPKLKGLPMLPHLVKLTLVNVSEELFSNSCQFTSLKTLRLENIEILDHFLPEDWLQHLISLEELHIGSCPSLVSLSQGMRHLKSLQSLSIWDCKGLDLSKDERGNVMELQGRQRLQSLTVYKASKLEYLPEWLSHVSTLRFLCIRSCLSLAVLPEWIGNLQSLELVHCPLLASLPQSIQQFTSSYAKKLTVIGCPIVTSQSKEIEAGKDWHEMGGEEEDWLEMEEE